MRPTITPLLLNRLRNLPPRPGGTVAEAIESMAKRGVAAESSGVVTLRNNFAFQSYFDSALIERGVLAQAVAEPIVPSTVKVENTAGHGIALYPSSESPVAVQLLLGSGKSGSATIILKPGDVYVAKRRFDGLRWGLPFGWLGGGSVQLRILQAPDDIHFLASSPEIVFHRIRLPIWGATDNPAASGRGTSANWPGRFPWPNAFDLNSNPQKGQSALGVTPTRTLFRLRMATLASAARMRFLLLQTDDLDLGSDNATLDAINVSGSWVDLVWPQTAASGFKIGGVATSEFPVLTQINDATCNIGGDSAIAVMIDIDGTLGSTGSVSLDAAVKVDIERYGTL